MKPSGRLAQYLTERAMIGVPAWSAPRSTARARARQMAAWALRTLCPDMSYPTIAHVMGWSNHPTAMHAFNRIAELRATDPEVVAASDKLVEAARADRSGLINEINYVRGVLTPAFELMTLMNDVRRAAQRMHEAVERVETYVANHPESLK